MTRFLAAVSLLLLLIQSAMGITWHIFSDGVGDAPTIQSALNQSAWGDSILCAPGTYYENLAMVSGRTLVSEEDPEVTILNGSNISHVIYCFSVKEAVISGFTIEDGRAELGGGLYCEESSFLFQGNIVRQNTVVGTAYGAGIYTTLCPRGMTIKENLIYDNHSPYIGGGICCNGDDRSTIFGNTIYGNTAPWGAGIITYNGSDILIERNIVVNNHTGKGVYVHSSATATILCNDVWFNTTANYHGPDQTGINGNISVDPLFCDPNLFDFHLDEESPCLPGNHPDGSDCELIGALPGGCAPNPFFILSITDVGNDQGRQVRVKWAKHPFDPSGPGPIVTHYSIFRRVDDFLLFGPGPAAVGDVGYGMPPGDWDFIKTVPAYGNSTYSTVCPTLCDSTIAHGDCWSVFFVRAGTGDPAVFYDTEPDSGQSVDNLSPGPPSNLRWESPGLLAWEESEAEDFDYFTVYGSHDPVFIQAEVIGYTIETEMDVSSTDYGYYHVTASDFSGNEGDPATIEAETSSLAGEELPVAFALRSIHPNPGGEPIRISFDLPREAALRLRVFDVTGRLVKKLVDDRRPAGHHALTWRATDDSGRPIAGGVYWVSMEAAGYAETRKLIILE